MERVKERITELLITPSEEWDIHEIRALGAALSSMVIYERDGEKFITVTGTSARNRRGARRIIAGANDRVLIAIKKEAE